MCVSPFNLQSPLPSSGAIISQYELENQLATVNVTTTALIPTSMLHSSEVIGRKYRHTGSVFVGIQAHGPVFVFVNRGTGTISMCNLCILAIFLEVNQWHTNLHQLVDHSSIKRIQLNKWNIIIRITETYLKFDYWLALPYWKVNCKMDQILKIMNSLDLEIFWMRNQLF